MTAKQITKRLTKAGIDTSTDELEISRDEVLVACGYTENEWGGQVDDEATAALAEKIRETIPELNGGFSNQWGGVYLKADYQPRGDFMDKSSRHHY